jgi:hypothetical protein
MPMSITYYDFDKVNECNLLLRDNIIMNMRDIEF